MQQIKNKMNFTDALIKDQQELIKEQQKTITEHLERIEKMGDKIEELTDRANWTNEECIRHLEKEGFQVYNVGSIDLLGAFNYHVKQVRELLSERKALQAEIEKLKAKKTKKASGVKL